MKISFDESAKLVESLITESQKKQIISAIDNIRINHLLMFLQKNKDKNLPDTFYITAELISNKRKTCSFNVVNYNDIYERIIKTLAGIKQKMEKGNLFDRKGIVAPKSIDEAYKILGLKIDKTV